MGYSLYRVRPAFADVTHEIGNSTSETIRRAESVRPHRGRYAGDLPSVGTRVTTTSLEASRAQDGKPSAIRGVRVWDGLADRVDPGPVHIRIEAGRIWAIGDDDSLLRDACVWSTAPGAVALPGLIDAHVHVTLNPEVRSVPDQLAVPDETVTRQSERRVHEMAAAGITTARDLGGGRFIEVALRDRIERGELPGPRLLCAGQPLTPIGGHCHFWGGEVGPESPAASVIARQVEHRVDWLKVMATGGINTKGPYPV